MRRPQLPDAAAALAAAGRAARPAACVSANTAASIDSATPIAVDPIAASASAATIISTTPIATPADFASTVSSVPLHSACTSHLPIAGTGTTSATAAEPCATAAVTSHAAPVHLRGGRRVRRSRGALLLGALMPRGRAGVQRRRPSPLPLLRVWRVRECGVPLGAVLRRGRVPLR